MSFQSTENVDEDTWAGILCIDPNGLRTSSPVGPLYYKLDTLRILPGLTDRSGHFVGTINDNKTTFPGTEIEYNYYHSWGLYNTGWHDKATSLALRHTYLADNPTYPDGWSVLTRRVIVSHFDREYDMMLLTPDSNYIRDNDEFWVGIQYGPVAEGLSNTWDGSTGRKWLMGGWITRRYYEYDDNGEITAHIEGADYMELWRTQPYGTPDDPKDYSENPMLHSTLVGFLHDAVNALQSADYRFTKHTTWGTGGMSGSVNRNISSEMAFDIMAEICHEEGYEWQIVIDPTGATPADRRKVMLYERAATAPSVDLSASRIAYETSIRSLPKIQLGETDDVATHIQIVREVQTIPQDDLSNFMHPGLWPDKDHASRRYSMLSFPPPPNPASHGWDRVTNSYHTDGDDANVWPDGYGQGLPGSPYSDPSQVIDSEGNPAICFQKHMVDRSPETWTFWNFLSFYLDDNGQPSSAKLDLDLRTWRRVLFNFKHGTRSQAFRHGNMSSYLFLFFYWYGASYFDDDAGSVYKLRLHTTIEPGIPDDDWYKRCFVYTFGKGTQNDKGEDIIDGDGWYPFDLLLPEIDDDGSVVNWHGWEPEYTTTLATADPLHIDFVSFEIECAEHQDRFNRAVYEDYDSFDFVNTAPYYQGYRGRSLSFEDALEGEIYLEITDIEKYLYRGTDYIDEVLTGELIFPDPKPRLLLITENGMTKEWVEVEAINGDYDGTTNVKLTRPLLNDWDNGTSDRALLPMGCSWSLSNFHFETGPGYTYPVGSRPTELQKPYRYRTIPYTDVELDRQATLKIPAETYQSIQYVEAELDGNPYLLIGHRVHVQLDPERETLFHNVQLLIDDITYTVDKTDFYCDVTLGTLDAKARVTGNMSFVHAEQRRKLTRLELGIPQRNPYEERFVG